MIIGVDGGALSVDDKELKVGVYKVTGRLLEKLTQIDNSNYYRIYTYSQIEEGSFVSKGSRAEERVLYPKFGWLTWRVPIELTLHPINIYLGLSQSLPFKTSFFGNIAKKLPLLSKNFYNYKKTTKNAVKKRTYYIGFVYDLGFIKHPDNYPDSYKSLSLQTDFLIRNSDHLVTISDYVKKDIVRRYEINPDLLTVAYPGVDEIFTDKGKKYDCGKPYFLFAGAFKKGKNIPNLIYAFDLFIRKTGLDYDLILAGSSFWPDSRINQAISKVSCPKRIKKLGFVTDSKLAMLYRGAVGLVSPALYEGFGLPLVEAMASGCPVISSSTGAVPEIVGDSAILIDPDNTSDIAEALEQLSQSRKIRKELIVKGLERSKKYSWDKMAKTVYGLYKGI